MPPNPQIAACHLASRGVPKEQPLLNCTWVRDAFEPTVNGAPHYTSVSNSKNKGGAALHLYLGRDQMWQIAPEVGARLAYAVARSAARHPNTVRAGEWLLPGFPISTSAMVRVGEAQGGYSIAARPFVVLHCWCCSNKQCCVEQRP